MKKQNWYYISFGAFLLLIVSYGAVWLGSPLAAGLLRLAAVAVFVAGKLTYLRRFGGSKAMAVLHCAGWAAAVLGIQLSAATGLGGNVLFLTGVGAVLFARHAERKADPVEPPRWLWTAEIVIIVLYAVLCILVPIAQLMDGTVIQSGENGDPFSHFYCIDEVLAGKQSREDLPRVRLELGNYLELWENPSDSGRRTVGKLELLETPEGDNLNDWELTPEDSPDETYHLSRTADETLILSYNKGGTLQWEGKLRRIDLLACSSKDKRGISSGTPDWYWDGKYVPDSSYTNVWTCVGDTTVSYSWRDGRTDDLTLIREIHAGDTVETQELTLTADKRGMYTIDEPALADGDYILYRIPDNGGAYIWGIQFADFVRW